MARGRVTRKRSIKRGSKKRGGYHGFKSKSQWRRPMGLREQDAVGTWQSS